jgi:hypothetical protein
MIENVLRDIGGVGLYGIISICLFVGVFVGAVIRVLRLKKGYVDAMSELPLEEGTEQPATQRTSNRQSHE